MCLGDRYGIIITRQPILIYYSLITVIKIRIIDGPFMKIHPSLIKHANGNFYGDAMNLILTHGASAIFTIPKTIYGMFSITVGYGVNKLTFPQPMVVRMYKYDHLLLNSNTLYGKINKQKIIKYI